MPEIHHERKIFTLLEVSRSIQRTLESRYSSMFWVKAEMNKLNFYSHSGHCYPELVEKQDGRVLTQIRSHLWRDDYIRIDREFRSVLGEPLRDGIKILFLAKVTFTPEYGLSLWIRDIDVSFTLGDLELEKRESIRKLQESGLFSRNRELQLPLLPMRIAVISVESSKGYADFINILENNERSIPFRSQLFPSLLQGEQAIAGILVQLKKIARLSLHFDAVAIIRGGGGEVGLSSFNDYELAKAVCEFPIPVLSGIGHATNETVVEMVSNYNAITPTKLAEFLVQKAYSFADHLDKAVQVLSAKSTLIATEEGSRMQVLLRQFRSSAEQHLKQERYHLNSSMSLLHRVTTYIPNEQKGQLREMMTGLVNATKGKIREFGAPLHYLVAFSENECKRMIKTQKDELDANSGALNSALVVFNKDRLAQLQALNASVQSMSPVNILKRGFSITRINGKALKTSEGLPEGSLLETELFNGILISKTVAST